MTRRGAFITLEGGEGSGKTSSLELLRAQLVGAGVNVVVTREPGGTPLAEALRELLLARREEPVAPVTETLLMFAARMQHLQEVIRPALGRGDWVVCDRFTDATWAYQGAGRGVDSDLLQTLQSAVHGDLDPDLTLYLDVPVEVGLARAGAIAAPDRFEAAGVAFLARVRAGYLARAAAQPQRFRTIDAARPQGEVQAALQRELSTFCARWQAP